ncbi:MAG: tRNA (guanosine(46)-N7)-methyltransferase TrmB [Pseudomonadota bacterium]
MTQAAPPAHRPIRSFVRREGRITAAQQQALEQLLPRYAIPADGTPVEPAALFGRSAPLGLEIGFGDGAHLAALAQARPDWDFIGLEVYRPGVGKLLQAVAAQGLDNVRVSTEDAQAFLRERLAPASLDAIYIQFPDPWPKKRHHKRRIVQADFALVLRDRLKPGGELQLATDWAEYAEHMLEVLEATPGLRNAAGPRAFSPRPANRIRTKFETRGQRLGHGVYDLVYRRD